MRNQSSCISIAMLAAAVFACSAVAQTTGPADDPAAVRAPITGTPAGQSPTTMPGGPSGLEFPASTSTTSPTRWPSGTLTLEPTTQPSAAGTTQPSGIATTLPSTQPTTLPATQPAAPANNSAAGSGKFKSMPPEYGIFTTRSMFMKGHIPPAVPTTPSLPTTRTSSRQESAIVFNGVVDTNGEILAMFEDTSVGKILHLKAGDAIADGKITQITLDTVTYESSGRSTRVTLGQTLDAGEAPLLTSRAVISNGSPTTAPTVGAVDDVLEKLRAKRRREMGGQ